LLDDGRRGRPERQALTDYPGLADGIDTTASSNSRHCDTCVVEDIEAFAALRIDDPTVGEDPLLCAGAVAREQLDRRLICLSTTCNVDTPASLRIGSDALYSKTLPIPLLAKIRVASSANERGAVARVSRFGGEAFIWRDKWRALIKELESLSSSYAKNCCE
jgi:hypothetical protein